RYTRRATVADGSGIPSHNKTSMAPPMRSELASVPQLTVQAPPSTKVMTMMIPLVTIDASPSDSPSRCPMARCSTSHEGGPTLALTLSTMPKARMVQPAQKPKIRPHRSGGCCRALRSTGSVCTPATVHDQDGAVHKAGLIRRQIESGGGDLVGLADAGVQGHPQARLFGDKGRW